MRFIRSRSKWTLGLLAVLLALLLAVGVYFVPPIHDRLAWRIEAVRARVAYSLNPPDEAVFQPTQQVMLETIVAQTMQAYQSATPPPVRTATASPRPGPTVPPTPSPTALPSLVMLEGVKYEDQHGRNNYCGPANFSMALTFWGWSGNRNVIGEALMPGNDMGKNGVAGNNDKNVMPYELQDYITKNVPGMTSLIRHGGDIDLLRRMVAAGYPVVVEKGIDEVDLNGVYSWMGHYAFVTGYDDAKREIIYQDTYQPAGAPPGRNRRISYEKFIEGWRAFNYIFAVVYPNERNEQVLFLLGDWADANWAVQHALDVAENESRTLPGIGQYFAWFNKGTSYVSLTNPDYSGAALAYDYAFINLYPKLQNDKNVVLPYRMMWYQTGPYKAYFFTNRFTDVIELANITLKPRPKPDLEESLFWRGKAETMIGDVEAAVADFRAALAIHPGWEPAIQALQDLGVQP